MEHGKELMEAKTIERNISFRLVNFILLYWFDIPESLE